GPGSNVFSYFVEPNGFVVEYTTEVDQVGDNYVGHDAKWWTEQNVFPCRWNMAGAPSPFARKAMGGELVEEESRRCEEEMAKGLRRGRGAAGGPGGPDPHASGRVWARAAAAMTEPRFAKTAVVGAGALGSYFGGLLAHAGLDVTLIGRKAHVDAINRDGLTL